MVRKMDRREFFRLSASGAAAAALLPDKLFGELIRESGRGNDAYPQGWEFKEHFKEWMACDEWPWPKEFDYAERIMPLSCDMSGLISGRTGHRIYISVKNFLRLHAGENDVLADDLDVIPPDGKFHYACLGLGPRERTDLMIAVGESPDRLVVRSDYKIEGAEGNVNFFFPIEGIESERVYYQVLLRTGKNPYRTFSPVRSCKHPKHNNELTLYFIADTHLFDDRCDRAEPISDKTPFESGLDGGYVRDFFRRGFIDPYWFRGKEIANLRPDRLMNSFHLANTLAWIAHGEQPDAIIHLGDNVGLQGYRLERQGLPQGDHEGNSEKLWKRERKVTSLLSPLVPTYFVLGNHEGEGGWEDTRSYAVAWRKRLFRQPGSAEGGSPDQNFYVIPFADGALRLIALDPIGYNPKEPTKPSEWTLGEAQMEWYRRLVEQSGEKITFGMFHHVIGGIAADSEGGRIGQAAYGRGPLFTREDYEKLGISPDGIEQIETTEALLRNGGSGFFYGHDHGFFHKVIGNNSQGRPAYGVCVGTPNEVFEESWWDRSEFWRKTYGSWDERRILNAPLITKVVINVPARTGYIEAICTSDPDHGSNICGSRIGDVLRRYALQL